MGVRTRAGPIIPMKNDSKTFIQALVPCPSELLNYFSQEMRDAVTAVSDVRRTCAEIRDIMKGKAKQPGKTGAVPDPELEKALAGGQGNVMAIRHLTKLLYHFFGTSLEQDEHMTRIILAAFMKEVEVIITVLRNEAQEYIPGSARIAALRSLEIGADSDYQSFRERYQFTLYDSPVCLPISAKLVPKTLYMVIPLHDYRFFMERGAILRRGRALIEMLPSRPDEYLSMRNHGECPAGFFDKEIPLDVTDIITSGRRQRSDPRYTVVSIDARHFALENGDMHVTRQGTFASRENIAIGYWRAVYMKDDLAIVYLRPWTYSPAFVGTLPENSRACFQEMKSDPNATKIERVRSVNSAPCHRCMAQNPVGAHLCVSCYLPIFYERVLPRGVGSGRLEGVIPRWVGRYIRAEPLLWTGQIHRTCIVLPISRH